MTIYHDITEDEYYSRRDSRSSESYKDFMSYIKFLRTAGFQVHIVQNFQTYVNFDGEETQVYTKTETIGTNLPRDTVKQKLVDLFIPHRNDTILVYDIYRIAQLDTERSYNMDWVDPNSFDVARERENVPSVAIYDLISKIRYTTITKEG